MKKMVESFEDLEIYRLAEELGDKIWGIVSKWDGFAKNTSGYQLVRAADSIGANIAEGFGRFHFAEKNSLIESPEDLYMKRAIGSAEHIGEAC